MSSQEDITANARRAERLREKSAPETNVLMTLGDNMAPAFVLGEKFTSCLEKVSEESDLAGIIEALNAVQTEVEQLNSIMFHKDFGWQHRLGNEEKRGEKRRKIWK